MTVKKQKLTVQRKNSLFLLTNRAAVIVPESEINNPVAEREVCWNDLDTYQTLSGSCSDTHL